MTTPGLALYRGATWALGLVLPSMAGLGPPGSTWRGSLTGPGDAEARAAGSVWIHAASLGEVGVAGRWARALLESGMRPPLLLTTRTRAGLARAAREIPDLVAARIAPLDLPQVVRRLLATAAPSRLDVIETEVWPNLILEARRAGLAVVFVSATVSERTARRLTRFGFAGGGLFGSGVFALAQDEKAAARFRALGIPADRVRATGDLKADVSQLPEASPETPPETPPQIPEEERLAVVFGSFRPGEEPAALAVAEALAAARAGPGAPSPILVVAPRHPDGAARARVAFGGRGYALLERGEAERAREPLARWIRDAAAHPGKRLALLTTHGELTAAYALARVALVGGTFAPFGGHNPLEPAARGCPVVVGPHHESIAPAIEALARAGGALVVPDPAVAAATVVSWWSDPRGGARGAAAARAARASAGAAERACAALVDWDLVP